MGRAIRIGFCVVTRSTATLARGWDARQTRIALQILQSAWRRAVAAVLCSGGVRGPHRGFSEGTSACVILQSWSSKA